MEVFEERRANVRQDINTRLDALEGLLTEELAQKLSERDQSFAIEKQQYNQDIRGLQAKIVDLEVENGKLLTELEFARQHRQGCLNSEENPAVGAKDRVNDLSEHGSEAKTVSIEEYEELKRYIARLDTTRQFLDSRYRHYKNVIREWREYTNRWILKHPGQGLRKLGSEVPHISPAAGTRDLRLSSAPAPPAIPDGVSSSMSDFSPVNSPRKSSERPQSRHKGNTPNFQRALHDKIGTTQRVVNTPDGTNSGELTEASDESEPLSLDPSRTLDRQPTEHNNLNARAQAEDSGSSPIIVSERSLKRKSHIKANKENPCPKALVKDEDSSPLARPNLPPISGLHDSLDLDDVGGHVDTPRKRRKLEAMRRQSSLILPAAVPDEEEMLDEPTMQRSRNDLSIEDMQDTGIQESPSLNPVAKNEDLDSEQQDRRSHKALSKAQQQAHNKRVSERLNTTEQPIVSSPQARDINAFRLGSEIGEGHPGSPTPTVSASRSRVQPGTPRGRRRMEPRSTALTSPIVLQPTDPNSHILPRTNGKPSNQKSYYSRSGRDRGAAHVPAVAEDGEDSLVVGNKSRPKQANREVPSFEGSRAPDMHYRLGTLMGEPSPVKSLLESANPKLRAQNIGSSKMPSVQTDQLSNAPMAPPATPSNIPAGKNTPETRTSDKAVPKQHPNIRTESNKAPASARVANTNQARQPSSRKLRSTGSSTDAQPKHQPLRNRSIEQLRYEDFKLNPAHNDYTYHETIRKHDEKKSLSGCTDRNCPRCKNIRAFVENSGYATTPGQDNSETDRRLLENYLGKGHTAKLKNLSAEERKELLLQARAQQFANEFGKHRTPFRRAQSPVGFWDVGMPSTQEHLRNLEKVGEREREEVREMYWEACRERGRYVFADE